MKDREGRVALGAPAMPHNERLRFGEVADALMEHYRVTGSRQLRDVIVKLKPVKAFFENYRIMAIDHAAITHYIGKRQAAELSNATVNRELSLLGKALRLAMERGQLMRVPRIHLLQESAPRSGFFERADFERVRRHLARRPDLQLAVTIAFAFGWRTQEILTLNLSQIDLESGTLRLEPGTTKNRDGRVVYLTPELRTMVPDQIARVTLLSRKLNQVIPYLFPNPRPGPWQGQPLQDFRKAWGNACAKAGLVGMLRHDLRRTAVRNLVRAGVPETVAMRITGHRTRSVFDRYNIVSDADLKDAAKKLHGHNTGTLPQHALATPSVSALN